MKMYEIKVLRDELLFSDTANTYEEAVKKLKENVRTYRPFYRNERVICDTDSKFELVAGDEHMCIWIEQTDSSSIFNAFERDMARFF